MFSKLLITPLLVLAYCVFIPSLVYLQTGFHDDSLKIVDNSNQLFTADVDDENQDSLIAFLGRGIDNPTDLSTDLIQFYLARYYYMRQDASNAMKIANRNIEDNYNPNDSDAKFYNIKGVVHSLRKEYGNAIQAFLKAAKGYQTQKNTLREHVIYNNIANIYLALGDYQRAYNYSRLCFSEFRNFPKDPNYLGFLGILIVCENNLDMLDSARVHIDLGFEFLEENENKQGEIIINFAKAELKYKNDEFHKSIPYALKSLKLSETYNLKQFQIMSEILLMNVHIKLKEYTLALKYGLSAKDNLKFYNNISMQHSISNGLSIAYANTGDYEKAYYFRSETDSLKTIDRAEKNKRNIDSLLVQFESLSSRNKILGQEATIAIQNHTIERRNNILILGSFALLLLVLFIVWFFVYNRQRLKLIRNAQEVEMSKAISASEEAERSRLSSELHDGLAAELTALKLELEQSDTTSKRALTMLKKAHQMTRRISHNLSPFMVNEKGLVEAIAYLVNNNNIKNNLHYYTNVSKPLSLMPQVETILYRSTQELIQNALKHANASEIVVQVILKRDLLSISVEDNGVGMEGEVINNSIGLGSLKKRIELIKGSLDIDSFPNRGTTVFINLKL